MSPEDDRRELQVDIDSESKPVWVIEDAIGAIVRGLSGESD